MYLKTIRIAVIACLIVSTTIQPLAALAMPGNCRERVCEQSQMCPGCGCCEVQSPSDHCCCCTQETKPTSQPNDDDQSPQERGDVLVAASAEVSVSRCTCGISTPPMDRPSPRDLVVRERSTRLSMMEFVVLDDFPSPIERPRVIDDSIGSRADFSQRVLCVWRI